MKANRTYDFLNFIHFKDVILWDVKRVSLNKIASIYPIVKLGDYIEEQSAKFRLFEHPQKEFKILGVNNKTGLFDAYVEKGSNINQPYKKMEYGWLAYNPYRINVGSIGYKHSSINHEYISPAYVVFSCKEKLQPEYLFILFKTNYFNKVIRDNTTGSVRQNLSSLKIPLPSLTQQKKLIKAYYETLSLVKQQEKKIEEIDEHLTSYLNDFFGIKKNVQRLEKSLIRFIAYKSIESQWGVTFNSQSPNWKVKPQYKEFKISELCQVSSGGTPSTSVPDYYGGDIPWVKTTEVMNDIIYDTEIKITKKGLDNSSAKLYPKNSLIIAMYGQGQTRGRTAKLGIEASTNQACAVLFNINNQIVLTDFLWVYLMNEYERLRELASGNNQPNLNAGMILNYKVQVPESFKIQQQVVDYFFEKRRQKEQLFKNMEEIRLAAQHDFENEIFKL